MREGGNREAVKKRNLGIHRTVLRKSACNVVYSSKLPGNGLVCLFYVLLEAPFLFSRKGAKVSPMSLATHRYTEGRRRERN